MEQKEVYMTERKEPNGIVEHAKKVAILLQSIIKNKKKPVIINNEQYIEFEDYQLLARFYNVTCKVEWTKEIREKEVIIGYEARALAISKDGREVSAAESMCLKTEKNWHNKDLFQLKSMAQTRACAKALRNVFAWVVVLAGYPTFPVEENIE